MIFQWIEKIRECLSEFKVEPEPEEELPLLEEEINIAAVDSFEFEIPEITHGEIITDRKSVFQGHAASVHSVEQVRLVFYL